MTNKEKMEQTVELMLSDNYKDRFKGEYLQLFYRVEGLAKMLDDWRDGKLNFEPTCDYFVYVEQLKAMTEYLHILHDRAMEEEISVSI